MQKSSRGWNRTVSSERECEEGNRNMKKTRWIGLTMAAAITAAAAGTVYAGTNGKQATGPALEAEKRNVPAGDRTGSAVESTGSGRQAGSIVTGQNTENRKGGYDYQTAVKPDDQAWADLQAAPAGGAKGQWGNYQPTPNAVPKGNDDEAKMHTYGAYSRSSDTESKVLYLTFDEGYENGYTPAILDTLAKHGIQTTFFCTGEFMQTQPELVRRMVNEGHIVGNHTWSHPHMNTITTHEAFWNQLKKNSDLFKTITGLEMPRYFRAPEGGYSDAIYAQAQAMGYKTIYWTVAYGDYDTKKQPDHASALATLNRRIHPGAVILLHAVSKTNTEILDSLLTGWENQGYTFGTLDRLQ